MSRALLWVVGVLVSATALGAQPQIAGAASSTQPEVAGTARNTQPEVAGAARGTQPEIAGTARSTQPMPPPLGRLFFTPTERAQLDIARIQKKSMKPLSTEEPAAAPLPQTVTYGGIVRRSDGRAMLWINNQLVDEKEAFSAMNVKGRVRSDGVVTIQVPDSRETINLKVGQSVEVHSGKIAETRRLTPEVKPPPADPTPAPRSKPPEPQSAEGKAEAGPAPAAKADPGARRVDPPENPRITGTK